MENNDSTSWTRARWQKTCMKKNKGGNKRKNLVLKCPCFNQHWRALKQPPQINKSICDNSIKKICLGHRTCQAIIRMPKMRVNLPLLWRHPRQTQTKTKKTFFSLSARRPAECVEGLDSSLAQSAGELLCCKAWSKKWPARRCTRSVLSVTATDV